MTAADPGMARMAAAGLAAAAGQAPAIGAGCACAGARRRRAARHPRAYERGSGIEHPRPPAGARPLRLARGGRGCTMTTIPGGDAMTSGFPRRRRRPPEARTACPWPVCWQDTTADDVGPVRR